VGSARLSHAFASVSRCGFRSDAGALLAWWHLARLQHWLAACGLSAFRVLLRAL